MCNESCVLFVAKHLAEPMVRGRTVLEVGSGGFGVRPLIASWHPSRYIGVDLKPGPGVDLVIGAENLSSVFEPNLFDVVLSTEMVEHVRDWRRVLNEMKTVTKPGGTIILTTRSFGYPFHAAPNDFWRYEVEDMIGIFSDLDHVAVEADPQEPGVFVSAVKPHAEYTPRDLSNFQLYSMVYGRRTQAIPPGPVGRWRAAGLVWAGRIRQGGRLVLETLRGRPPGLRFQVEIDGTIPGLSKPK